MRIFKTKRFAKWAKKEGLADKMLVQAVEEMGQGLVDADLGGHVFKKRIASRGQGKRGSFRTILAFKLADKAFFIFGFAKNKLDNINKEQLNQLKILSSLFMRYSNDELNRALNANELIEVCDE